MAFFGLRTGSNQNVNGTSFKLENVNGFRAAYLMQNNKYLDVTEFGRFDPIARSIQFNHINITHDFCNMFNIQF